MQIGVYGSGYLATVVSACLADLGTPVTCFDTDSERVKELAQGTVAFYEKNLSEIIRRNVRSSRLRYSTEVDSQAARSQIVFVAQDSARGLEQAAVRIAAVAPAEAPIVICTPSPVGTVAQVERLIRARNLDHPVVSHPLFLTNGCAVEDFNWPDRVLLGTRSSQAVATIKALYRPLVMRGVPVIVTNFETAELVREAGTAFVATKISFINELAALCERVNADAKDLALALGLDKRIAPRCLTPGVELGGAFVEADMDSLAMLASENGVSLRILAAARDVQRGHAERVVEKIATAVHNLSDKRVGLLGLSFKPHTSSVAGSASMALARELASNGATVHAYDPVAMPEAERELRDGVRYCESAYAAAEGTDALVVGTGWPEFRALDFARLRRLVKRPIIVDTKNLLDCDRLRGLGFQYMGVGRA
ncbi:MAG TPA: nucleotide sugar dehydrogenase [Clostridia bacterium]|nr:nucleotide sugar dehydrogenase [Clostridia bacterium]